MRIAQRLKLAFKAEERFGKIYYVRGHRETFTSDKIPGVGWLNINQWKTLERNKRCMRSHISSRKYNVGDVICKGDFKLWVTVFNILNGIFFNNNEFPLVKK